MRFYLFAVLILVVSCRKISPAGKIEVREIPVKNYSKVNLNGKFRVFYVLSDSSFVNVETYPNLAENLQITIKKNTLDIAEKRPVQSADFYNLTLYSKQPLTHITLQDSVEFNISTEIQAPQFNLDLRKNSKFIGSLKTAKAKVEMEGNTRANLAGSAKSTSLTIKGGASLIAPYWNLNTADLTAGGNTYTEISVADSLRGIVSKTAQVVYYGDPVRALNIEKSAKVENRELP